MIDYDKPDDDPVVAEVRRAREEIAAGFDFNLRAACEEMQRRQATSGRRYVSTPPPGRSRDLGADEEGGGNQPRSLSMLPRRPTRTAADAASTCPSG
jgi:hypothetical protein